MIDKKLMTISVILASALLVGCGGGGGSTTTDTGDTGGDTGGDTTSISVISPTTFDVLANHRKVISISTGSDIISGGTPLYEFAVKNANGATVQFDSNGYGFLTYTAPSTAQTQTVDITVSNSTGSKDVTLTFNVNTKDSVPAVADMPVKIMKTGAVDGGSGLDRSFTTNPSFNIVDAFNLEWANTATNVETGNFTYASAVDKCSGLGTGWRLPTVDEALNLVNYSYDNGVDYTSTPMSEDVFADGLAYSWAQPQNDKLRYVSYINGVDLESTASASSQYRCVKGTNSYDTDHFIIQDGVTGDTFDLSTGLQWSKAVAGAIAPDSGNSAADICSNMSNLRGQGDWRLPSINELRSVIEEGTIPNSIMGLYTTLLSSTEAVGTDSAMNYGLRQTWDRNYVSVYRFFQSGDLAQQGVSCVREFSDADISSL